jgi:excisionase family DNA binding protein
MHAPTEQSVSSPAAFPPSPWLTVNEAADRARCGPRLIYRAVAAGRLRAVRLGGRRELRVLAEWLDAWLLDQAPLLDTQGRLIGTNGSGASS